MKGRSRFSRSDIRPTRAGVLLLVMTILAFVPAYLLSVTLMFLMGAMFLGILLYNLFAVARATSSLSLSLSRVSELFAGQPGQLHLTVKHGGRRGTLHNLQLSFKGHHLVASRAVIATLEAGKPLDLTTAIEGGKRGFASLDTCCIISAHPFGLVRSRRYFSIDYQVLVYPGLVDNSGRALYATREAQGMVPRSSDDFVYLAAYQPGDDVRRIHWKKSTLLENPVLKRDLAHVEVVTPRLFVPDSCEHFEFALRVLTTHFAIDHHLEGWNVLTSDGLVKTHGRDEILRVLALVEPLDKALGHPYEEQGLQVLYASSIEPG